MKRLFNQVMNYAWGSRSAIASLQGRQPTEKPEAELWLGAHVLAPSRVDGVDGTTLDAVIAAAPVETLGAPASQRFGQLPFLLKVLAAAEPLSLQAHPSVEQAMAGFAAENAAGLALTDSKRIYKDANHKPEIICALTEFEALCGFRPVSEARAVFTALNVPRVMQHLNHSGNPLRETFQWLMRLQGDEKLQLIGEVTSRSTSAVVKRLHAKYPQDIGVVAALLLNHVTLQPGEALFLPAGNLHGYLQGVGVELMANSDNVLRGGLTPKHVDVEALISILTFEGAPAEILKPTGAAEARYQTPVPEFSLSRIAAPSGVQLARTGPDLMLCVEGSVELATSHSLTLRAGEAAFIAHAEGPVTLTGSGTVFRATVGPL